MTQLESWALDIKFLIGLLAFLLILFVVVVAVWTGLKVWVFRVRQKREEQLTQRRAHDSDGRPLPPVGEGLCDRCQGVFDKVYHLPSGQRLCAACFESAREASE